MRPPICALCDRDQRDDWDLNFSLVRFRDFETLDRPGHPKGVEWFCDDHVELARKYEDLPFAEAMKQIRKESGGSQ